MHNEDERDSLKAESIDRTLYEAIFRVIIVIGTIFFFFFVKVAWTDGN